ncbi:NEK protein kinase [Phytophthora cinnamomi]|uniref:NEK protein kinase n=1 Tax=Phytophthora cinnamomi TaxID=4785 RepID=UPI00355AB969|nr:NEK protein kinase [Phytophthora cinnamomi]
MPDIPAYETLTVLGSGQFGSVLLVRRNSDRKLFAAKVPHGEDAATKRACRQEAELLMQLRHVNIVQFVELVEDDTQLALIMEYASGGDLDAFLQWQQESTGHLSETAIMRIFIQVVLALQYLHRHHILHRDLKPKNILLDGDAVVKLSDFGVSKIVHSSLDSAQTITGTPHYMSPEILEGGAYDCKSDVWSLGCVLYELATFSPPFTGLALGSVVGKILHTEPPSVSHRYSPSFRALIANLLDKTPSKRPGLSDILSCEAVQNHMTQLVSVATSHQPMILEQFAARNSGLENSPPLECVSPLPHSNYIHSVGDQAVPLDPPPISSSPAMQTHSEVGSARQLFFENQAAARKNKERIDRERSRGAVFLDCDVPSSGPRAQSSPSNYEELLNVERRRIQLETKALQERMRAMQTAD